MDIPPSHVQERLSVAYISAVTAKAGIKLFGLEVREYGIDGYLQAVRQLPNGNYAESGPILQFQMKSTTQSTLRGENVIYPMEAEAFNKLVNMDVGPRILILYRMPKDENNWLNIDEEKLLLSHCGYWTCLTGPPTTNKSSYTISIPRNQVLTPESLQQLLIKVRQGHLNNGYSAQQQVT